MAAQARSGVATTVLGALMVACCIAGPAVAGAVAGGAIGGWLGILAAVVVALAVAGGLMRRRRAPGSRGTC